MLKMLPVVFIKNPVGTGLVGAWQYFTAYNLDLSLRLRPRR